MICEDSLQYVNVYLRRLNMRRNISDSRGLVDRELSHLEVVQARFLHDTAKMKVR